MSGAARAALRAGKVTFNLGGWALAVAGLGGMALAWLAPPLIDVTAEGWRYNEGEISASVEAVDLKGCHRVQGKATGYVYADEAWWPAGLVVDGPPRPAIGAGPGRRWLGRWAWTPPEDHRGVSRVMGTLLMVCDGRPVAVDVGPFEVGG